MEAAAVLTRCRLALRSRTAAARRGKRRLLQLLEQRMEVGIQIKMSITKVFTKINRIIRMVEDRIMPIMAGTTAVAAAAVPTMTKRVLVHAE
jgi:hypothetical protein